jgi:hypothetical protein
LKFFLATKARRHEENLIADYTDDSDLIGHKKAQKNIRLRPDSIGTMDGQAKKN